MSKYGCSTGKHGGHDSARAASRCFKEADDARRVIARLERLMSSVNGNPRYRVHFTDGSSAVTQSDAAFCYEITNPEFRNTTVHVKFSRAGRITDIKAVASA